MPECEITQQAFRQMGLDLARIFGDKVKQTANERSIFEDDEEEQEIDPTEFADESDDFGEEPDDPFDEYWDEEE